MLRGGFKAIHGDLLHIRFREKVTKIFVLLDMALGKMQFFSLLPFFFRKAQKAVSANT